MTKLETYTDPPELCAACGDRPSGHGHFAQFCQLCSELPYGQVAK